MCHDNLTQTFIQGKKLDPKFITSYKIDPKIYFPAEEVPSKIGTSCIPIHGSYLPPPPLRGKYKPRGIRFSCHFGGLLKAEVMRNTCFHIEYSLSDLSGMAQGKPISCSLDFQFHPDTTNFTK